MFFASTAFLLFGVCVGQSLRADTCSPNYSRFAVDFMWLDPREGDSILFEYMDKHLPVVIDEIPASVTKTGLRDVRFAYGRYGSYSPPNLVYPCGEVLLDQFTTDGPRAFENAGGVFYTNREDTEPTLLAMSLVATNRTIGWLTSSDSRVSDGRIPVKIMVLVTGAPARSPPATPSKPFTGTNADTCDTDSPTPSAVAKVFRDNNVNLIVFSTDPVFDTWKDYLAEFNVPYHHARLEFLPLQKHYDQIQRGVNDIVCQVEKSNPAVPTPVATTPVATTPVATTPAATTPVATIPVATTPAPSNSTMTSGVTRWHAMSLLCFVIFLSVIS